MRPYTLAIVVLLALGACDTVAEKNNAGNDALSRGNHMRAIRSYQAAQVAEPDRHVSYYNAGLAYAADGDYQKAIDALRFAARTEDDSLRASAMLALGNIHYQSSEYDMAIEAYRIGLLAKPDDNALRHNLEVTMMRFTPPTPTAVEQQTEPETDQTDPEATPTDNPGGFDNPTPSPPPVDIDATSTATAGEASGGSEQSATAIPQSQGEMTVEQAEEILDRIQQDQRALREFYQIPAGSGEESENDW